MKRSFLVAIVSIAWLTPVYADQVDNIAVATAMVDAINSRNLDALDTLVAPNVVRKSAATAGVTVNNLDDFKAFLQEDFSNVPDSVMSIDLIFGNQEYVAMRATYSGTQTEQMGQFPPTGKPFELPFIGILKFDGGKISQIWVEWDNVFLLNQLGHLGQPSD